MTKRVKESVQIAHIVDYCGCTVKDLIVRLCEYSNEYGDDAVIHADTVGYDGPEEYYIEYERDETEEELMARLNTARLARERKASAKAKREEKKRTDAVKLEEQERVQYETLKKKFG